MRVLLGFVLLMTIAGCSAPLPAPQSAAPLSSPVPNAPSPDDFRKLGPELRRYLLQRGRRALEAPETLSEQLRPVTVVIQARSDITQELADNGARVRSVTQDGVVVITADVPLTAIPSLLALPELIAMELTQPVPPAEGER